MPTTFAVGIDENPLYATRAEQDKNGDQIDLTYAKKSEVPAQLTAASGLTIESDVIGAKVDGTTITVNQNGELESIGGGGDIFYATYGVTTFNEIVTANQAGKTVVLQKISAFGESGYDLPLQTVFISNHPEASYAYFTNSPRTNYVNGELVHLDVYRVNGNDIWTTSGTYPITYPTSGDIGKVLTCHYTGRVSWEGSVDNWSEAYNAVNVSGDLWNSTYDTVNSNSDSWDSVYDTVSNNSASWDEAYDVVSASAQIWNEAASMDEYPVSAGPGISIEDVDDVTVFSTSGVMMEADIDYNGQGEISGYNGSPIMTVDSEKQWLTHDDTICHVTNSAQYAFGVNVPVVAKAMEIDETNLFSNTSNVSSCTLSETIQNFNRFKIGVRTNSGEELFEFTTGSNGTSYDIVTGKGNNQGVIAICQFTVSGTAITAVRSEGIVFSWGSNPSYRHNEDMNFIQNVYGVGRKENT